MNRIKLLLSNSFYILLAYLPFHALITTILISNFGGELIFKGLKDAAVFIIFIASVLILFINHKSLKIKKLMLFSSVLNAYILIVTLTSIFNQQSSLETFAGMLLLMRPIWIFFTGVIIFSLIRSTAKANVKLRNILIFSSLVVVTFGALQVLVLPKDFLSYFGYGADTIKPYQTIDNNESFIRILSTLRGPNPLGAYLAMMAPIALYFADGIKKNKSLKTIAYSALFLITAYGSHSRSAWVGIIAGVGIFYFLLIKNKVRMIPIASVLVLATITGYLLRNTDYIQNIVFHRDPSEASNINSDDNRLNTIKYAIKSVNEKPFGHGVGASGPASNYGTDPVIIENQFLDIAYQIGWLGMIAYISFMAYVGYLLVNSKNKFALAHFSGLVGINVIALFWPVWTDDTVALLWWGVAGLLLSPSIIESIKKKNSKV